MQFQLTDNFIETLQEKIGQNDAVQVKSILEELHFADIAEIIDDLNLEEAIFIVKLLDSPALK